MCQTKTSNDLPEGTRVTTQWGEAVFTGYCWVEGWLYPLWDSPLVEPGPDEDYDEVLWGCELGTCSGCGAYWGHWCKWVTCVHCGRGVSLT